MKHGVAGKKLGRATNTRKALRRNLVSSLFVKGNITTTKAKAKFVKPYSEKLITLAKKNRLANLRKIASSIEDKAFKRLLEEIAPGFKNRQGGYTRITQLSPRKGDAAPMVKLELLEFEKIEAKVKKEKSVKITEKKPVKVVKKPKKATKKVIKK